jgi:membrane carboxypeptidase/penicillin-binding protein
MRTLLKILLAIAGAGIVVLGAILLRFFFYTHDLPDTGSLAQFAPAAATTVFDPCLKSPTNAIPYDEIGANLRAALSGADLSETDPRLSAQVSRILCFAPSNPLKYNLHEIRISVQLARHFSRRELFTMYANRAYFGDGMVGVDAASQHFFLKNPYALTIAEAALLAGLPKGPLFYSPVKHPDRALQRRNQVIDVMLAKGAINTSQADAAKATALGIAPAHVSTMPP